MTHKCKYRLAMCTEHPKWSVVCSDGDIWYGMKLFFVVYPPNGIYPERRFETYGQAIRYAQDRAKMKR